MLWRSVEKKMMVGLNFVFYDTVSENIQHRLPSGLNMLCWLFGFVFLLFSFHPPSFIFIFIINEEYFALRCPEEVVRNSNLKPTHTHIQLWWLRLYTNIDRSAD
jgi:hypothetical protein